MRRLHCSSASQTTSAAGRLLSWPSTRVIDAAHSARETQRSAAISPRHARIRCTRRHCSELADICIDDHDIDLAVSYLERVTRLRRLRNDDKGALKLYRKIVTIAPYRDDILAMLMRAQANGRFDE